MIFTALSFLQLIYGLFFTRRKCQLDSMERPHYIKYLAVYIKHISISESNFIKNITLSNLEPLIKQENWIQQFWMSPLPRVSQKVGWFVFLIMAVYNVL